MAFPNLYIGTMSKNCIDAVIDVANKDEVELGLICSRRQVDYDKGYTGFTTQKLYEYIRKRTEMVYLCRDHAGPGQGVVNDDGKKSLLTDVRCMDIIHIDPWKISSTLDFGIEKTIELMKYCYKHNSNVKFEIGTEEAIFKYSPVDLRFILQELERNLDFEIFGNIVFACIQSGVGLDLLNRKNIGVFDEPVFLDFIDICSEFQILPKEHNSDYVELDDIIQRIDLGLFGFNIAPEIGSIESEYLWYRLSQNEDYRSLNDFYNLCINYPYQKWLLPGQDISMFTKEQICHAFGHYVQGTSELKLIKEKNNISDYEIVQHIREYLWGYMDSLYDMENINE